MKPIVLDFLKLFIVFFSVFIFIWKLGVKKFFEKFSILKIQKFSAPRKSAPASRKYASASRKSTDTSRKIQTQVYFSFFHQTKFSSQLFKKKKDNPVGCPPDFQLVFATLFRGEGVITIFYPQSGGKKIFQISGSKNTPILGVNKNTGLFH